MSGVGIHAVRALAGVWPCLAEPQPLTRAGLRRAPVSQTLAWRDALGLFDTLGDVEQRNDGVPVVPVGDIKTTVHQSRGGVLERNEITMLCAFLQRPGLSADRHGEMARDISVRADRLLAAVSHHQAKICQITSNRRTATGQDIKPCDPYGIQHRFARTDRDRQHGKRAQEDTNAHAQIAAALAQTEKMHVVGQRTVHTYAAHHRVAYLAAYHPETHARVVSELGVHVSSVTPAQLQQNGQPALDA